MTAGFPDYQGFPNSTGSSIADTQSASIASGSPYVQAGYITNFPSARVHVKFSQANVGLSVTVAYFADQSMADPCGNYSWQLTSGTELLAILPTLGNYVQITVATAFVPAFTVTVQLSPLTVPADQIRYPVTGNEAIVSNHSIGAGNTFTVLVPFVVEGIGHVFVYPHDVTGTINAEVDELTQSGSVAHKVTERDGLKSTSVWDNDFQAPAASLQLSITNTDTVGHTVDACLVVTGR